MQKKGNQKMKNNFNLPEAPIQKKIEVLLLKTLTKKMAKSLHGLKKGLACSIMCSMIQKCSATV